MLKRSATGINLPTVASIDPTVIDTLVEETAHGDDVLIQRDGETVLVAVSVERYEELAEAKYQQDWARILAVAEQNDDLDPDEVNRIVTEEVELVREQMSRARRQR